MNVLCFLNELSETPPAPDEPAGRARLDRLLDTVLAVRKRVSSARPVLRVAASMDSIELSPGYPIGKWRHDTAVSRDRRLLMMQMVTQAPYLERGRDPDDHVEGRLLTDCFHQGRLASGISAARAADSLSVSLASAACWDVVWLDVMVAAVKDAGIEESPARVRHASAATHVGVHEPWLRELERLSVKDGRDLWDRRRELFPALELCKEVRQQLEEFLGGDPELTHVMNRLVQLQVFFQQWEGEPIGPDSLPSKCSRESGVTLKKYADEHTFTAPDGTTWLFSWHVRFTPGAGRIFFEGEPSTRKGLIGYIGKRKLPTVSDPT